MKEGIRLRECMLCKAPTFGSIGASGIRWPCICQKCKDEEDNILLKKIEAIAKGVR
jgi:hypothetical protein